MAFVPAKRSIATYPISVYIYNDAGKKEEIRFIAQYHRQTKTQLDDLSDGMTNRVRIARGEDPIKRPDGSIPTHEEMSDIEFLQRYMSGWTGVKGGDGTNLPCTPGTIAELLEDYPELVFPLTNGFWSAHRQISEKN